MSEDRGRNESEPTFHLPRELPMSAAAGVLSGIIGGCTLGAALGPAGALLGIGLGLVAGVIAGNAIAADERRGNRRTRELDAIIGITEGSMGAGPVSRVPVEHVVPTEGEGWLSEWLTPPPPAVKPS